MLAEFGSDNFRLSQVHVGSGYRLRKVLEKAERGEKLRIGVLGGSGECSHSPDSRLERQRLSRTWPAVSLGHGTDPQSGQRNKYGAVPPAEQWHQFVVRYIQQTFPAAEHEFRLGAKAATDSSFFEWCWSSLMWVLGDVLRGSLPPFRSPADDPLAHVAAAAEQIST